MTTAPLTVKYRLLLAILGVAPLALVFVLVDQIFLHGTWRTDQHITPSQIAYWTAILTLPHIVASMLGFADREYLSYYRKPLLKGLVISLGLAIIGQIIIGGYAILFILASYTMYHNVQQQFGITAMILRMPQNHDYKIMKWLFIIPSALGYLTLMLPQSPDFMTYIPAALAAIGICLCIATIFAWRVLRDINKNPDAPKIGLHYFAGNIAALYISYAMILSGYGFLATLISRLTHDLTAYGIYMVHDHNRQTATNRNWVYWLPAKIGLRPVFLCVPLALIISLVMLGGMNGNMNHVAVIFAAMNFMHYYMEGHMWKRGTPHRQHVPFV